MTPAVDAACPEICLRNTPMLSALIRTFDSASTLERTLESLVAQVVRPDEIVIVDSGSTDATLEIAARFDCRVVRYPTDRPFNYSHSLNVGVATCRGECILILSSHCVLVFPDVAGLMRTYLETYGASGVYCVPGSPETVAAAGDDPLRGRLISVVHTDNYDGSNGLWNCCSMVRRDCWETHPFDETLPACEDQEWAVWHHRHSRQPTVAIRNAGVLYLNPRWSIHKDIRERIIVATRIWPPLRSWRAITGVAADGVFAGLHGRFRQAVNHLRMAAALTASRLRR